MSRTKVTASSSLGSSGGFVAPRPPRHAAAVTFPKPVTPVPGVAAAAAGNLLPRDVHSSLRALEICEGLSFLGLLNSKAYLYSNWVKE